MIQFLYLSNGIPKINLEFISFQLDVVDQGLPSSSSSSD